MNKEDVRSGISKSWELVKSVQLEETFSFPQPYTPSAEFRDICLNSEVRYEDIYLTGLKFGDYNILLKDYAFLQFGISSEHHVRYAYYPNPFLGHPPEQVGELFENLQEGGVDAEEYLHYVSELRTSQHPPLLRYENAPEQYSDLKHPCSHFHFGHHADNRWPLRRVLTPAAFCTLVLKHFYGKVWFSADRLKMSGRSYERDEFLSAIRLDCRVLPDHLFSEAEKSQFYWE